MEIIGGSVTASVRKSRLTFPAGLKNISTTRLGYKNCIHETVITLIILVPSVIPDCSPKRLYCMLSLFLWLCRPILSASGLFCRRLEA